MVQTTDYLYVVRDDEILNGEPIVRGTRTPIRAIVETCVNVLVADLIRVGGFDVISVRDAGRLRAADDEQLAYAISQGRTLVTHNRADFEELVQSYFETGQMHYAVIFAVRRSPQEIARRLLAILNQVSAEEMQNQVRYIGRRVRHRAAGCTAYGYEQRLMGDMVRCGQREEGA